MKNKRPRKALLEEYGRGKALSVRHKMEYHENQVLLAFKGFCYLYPISIPEMKRKTHE